MVDEENSGVKEEVTAPDTSSQEPREETPSPNSIPSREDQEHNWREMRSAFKELSERNRLLEDKLSTVAIPQEKEEIDEMEGLADDDIVTKKQVLQRERRLEKRIEERALKTAMSHFQSSTAEERLELKHPDFKNVCSPENIDELKNRHPELAKSLATNPDPFSQGRAAYDLIKSLGISSPDAALNKQKIQENSQKPRLSGSAKAGPLDSAHLFESGQKPSLSKNLKAQLWQETQEAMKGF